MGPMIEFLQGLTVWHWWGLAGVLLVLELVTGTTYILWPAAAAALVGLLALTPLPFGWELQLVAFAVVTGALTMLGDKYVAKRRLSSDKPTLNEKADQLAGEKVIAADDFIAGRGRVRFGDSVWAAVLTADAAIAKGAVLEVVGVDGATLQVRAVA